MPVATSAQGFRVSLMACTDANESVALPSKRCAMQRIVVSWSESAATPPLERLGAMNWVRSQGRPSPKLFTTLRRQRWKSTTKNTHCGRVYVDYPSYLATLFYSAA